jgi:hypothetical protein
MHTSSEVEFEIKDCLSEDLSTRNRASHFFETMELSNATSVVVNFAQVQSITRSFADEYMKRKKVSKLTIHERNVPSNVQKMFEIVSAPSDKKRVVNIAQLKIGML